MDAGIRYFAERMTELLPVLMREFSRRQANELTKGDITLPQMVILDLLNKKGECIMSELAYYLAITTSAVTGLIDRMLEADLVTRERSKSDRRIVDITLTKKGGEMIRRILEQRKKMIIDMFSEISQKDRDKYLEILGKVCRTLNSDIG